MLRRSVFLTSVLWIAFCLIAGCGGGPAPLSEAEQVAAATLTRLGQEAPDFTLPLPDGGMFTLSEHRGKVVLLNWWATWCAPCREEIPHLRDEVWTRFRGKAFTMISISREEKSEVVMPFVEANGMTWLQAIDPDRGAYGKYASAYIPRNYVIGPDGRILFQSQGYNPFEFEQMVDLIARELDRFPPPRF